MKFFLRLALLMAVAFNNGYSQTPVHMANQSGLTYTENFADIANWVFNTTSNNGTFTSGVGAQAWKGIDVTTTTPAIPNATRVTTLSNLFQVYTGTTYSGGIYKGNQAIYMLSTGTTDNSSSVAFDFFMDFTGVNAGTLSFDWASLNNNTGNRSGSLRVYASTDGVAYTEITAAQVLNFINSSPTNGSITSVALPSSFSGSATARLRFYYHNGSGGTAGSRPRINIDNVKVTALATTPCTTPTAQPAGFTLGTVLYNTINFSFTAASPAPENYLVVMSKNNSLSSFPVDFTGYNIGDNLGDGTVVAITNTTSVTVTGLTNSTKYYFYIFSMNNACTGGPLYYGSSPLTGSATTLAGQLPCAAPTVQPTNLVLSNITTTSISGSFTAATGADEYLIVRTTSPTFTGTLNNGTFYNGGNTLGNGSVVTRTTGTNFTANNLTSGLTYYFFVFALNSQNCNNAPAYNTVNPLKANATTVSLPVCVAPAQQPTQLNLVANATAVNGYFIASATADGYLVLRSTSSTLSALPTNGTSYAAGTTLGIATVVANMTATAFSDNGLSAATTYYYFVFAKNSICSGTTPLYLTVNPLQASTATTATATSNYYFGNLHAHSFYSDGNKDNSSLTPADDYAYAKNSLCMDFLGISEHNHSSAGMLLGNYALGLNQAAAATTPSFLALYGMEYGVISNGGHVLIYGSNKLFGWEPGNYNTYVALSNYTGTPESDGSTGLFRVINNINNAGSTAFASLAHPDNADYNNLANVAYNAVADSAIRGCAVASGPAFSTATNYNDPPSAYAYLDYYLKMLTKGYHIGPFMDHDTHYTNFGRSNNNRLGVVASSLNSNDFYTAIKNRNFYATEDCDTRVNFSLNNEKMGSILTGSNPPAVSVYAIDPTNPTAVPSIKIMMGIAGSGVLPTQVANGTNNVSYTDNSLANGTTAYYYADITIAGNRTVTSPIWYTKTNTLPVKFTSFTASLTRERTVLIAWETSNEINNDKFIVEKSLDGKTFFAITTVNATSNNNYSIIDTKPTEGINYYRIKQLDKDGKFSYTNTVVVNLKSAELNTFTIVQNPVQNILSLRINATKADVAQLVICDIFGRIVYQQKINTAKGYTETNIGLPAIANGNYVVSLVFDKETLTRKFSKVN